MQMMRAVIFFAAAAAMAGGVARAAPPSAIVEDATDGINVAFMDYVEPGRIIALGADGKIVLGYLRSCLRETITGGDITVGTERSAVRNGRIETERVECDGGALQLTSAQAAKGGVLVLRAPAKAGGTARMPRAQFTLYGTSPLIRVAAAGRVVITRLDRDEKPLEIEVRGRFVDLAIFRTSLKPGGLYRATNGKSDLVFKVDAFARPGPEPIIGRLIAFE